MANFKSFSGTEDQLKQVSYHEGYIYFTTDKNLLYVDMGGSRFTIGGSYAQKLRKYAEDGQIEIEIDPSEILKNTDIIDIAHGGTGAETAESARQNLEVYSKSEVDDLIKTSSSVIFTATLSPSGWIDETEKFTYNYPNSSLTCGSDGNIPPMITSISNKSEYSKIIKATATPKTGIIFEAKNKPTKDIMISITDIK